MDELIAVLHTCELFHGLPEGCIQEFLLPHGILRKISKNAEIIVPQKQVDWFAIILEGRIQNVQLFFNGTRSLMEILGPRRVLGADLICTENRLSSYYAIAGSPSQILTFSRDVLTEKGPLPESVRILIWQRLAALLARETMQKHDRLAVLSQHGLRNRILIYLTIQADRTGSSAFQIPFTRDEMADYLCVNRSALSHELSKMRTDGLIQFQKNQFTLLPAGTEQSLWLVET